MRLKELNQMIASLEHRSAQAKQAAERYDIRIAELIVERDAEAEAIKEALEEAGHGDT